VLGLCVGSVGVGMVEVGIVGIVGVVGVVGVEWVEGVVGVEWVEGVLGVEWVEGVVGDVWVVGAVGAVGAAGVTCLGTGEVGGVLTLDELAWFWEAFRLATFMVLNAGKLLWKGLSTLSPCE